MPDQKKRHSVESISSNKQLEAKNPANIKISIEESQPLRKAIYDNQPTYIPMRSSQIGLYKNDPSNPTSNAYQSLSEKKRQAQHWRMPTSMRLKPLDDVQQMYHVTIKIDPSGNSPSNNHHVLSTVEPDLLMPASPYHYDLSLQQARRFYDPERAELWRTEN